MRLTRFALVALAFPTIVSAVDLGRTYRTLFTKIEATSSRLPGAATSAFPANLGDGLDDQVLVVEERDFHVASLDNQTSRHWCWIKDIIFLKPLDLDGDSLTDLVFQTRNDTSESIFTVAGRELVASSSCSSAFHLVFEHPRILVQGDSKGTLTPEAAVDLNGDSVRDMLCSIHSGAFALQPRGLFVIDGKTHAELWHYYFGPWPVDVQVVDLNGDGDQEIVLVGQGVGNGSTANGISDSACYLFAFKKSGEFAWPPLKLGGPTTHAYYKLLRSPGSGKTDIVVAVRQYVSATAASSILIISGDNGNVLCRNSRVGGYTSVELIPDGAKGGAAVVAGTLDGKVVKYSPDLVAMDSFSLPLKLESTVLTPMDIDNDSLMEIPVMAADNAMRFINTDMDSVFTLQFNTRTSPPFLLRTSDSMSRRFLIQAGMEIAVWTVRRVNKSFSEVVPPPFQIGTIASALIGLIGVLYAGQRRRYLGFLNAVYNDSSRLILGLDHLGRIVRSNQEARDHFAGCGIDLGNRDYTVFGQNESYHPLAETIRQFLSGHEPVVSFELKTVQAGSAREFLAQLSRASDGNSRADTGAILIMQDITTLNQAKVYETWTLLSKGLAHDARKPLAPLRLMLQDLASRLDMGSIESTKIRDDYIAPSLEQVGRMTRLIDRWTANLSGGDSPKAPVRISDILRYVVTMRRSMTPESLPLTLADDTNGACVIQGNREDLERAISELIENALVAIKGRPDGKIEVECRLDSSGSNYFLIRVRDNGTGIPSTLLPRIFEPGVTTGKGEHRGMGLFNVRWIIEQQHGGTIEVESADGIGTTFAVSLPVVSMEAGSE
ncbi:hypothetical protein C3F09_11495 [candidate division GN15 bacterium]|uniref:histidine kinase n=1 Tax=candidate division GN15 bacterium TaxID=2072418 RepID=A0A855WVD6_9BACT|nr:MAG: hypothetical protein C3F09_11495 [candidate division GN15 bacterium]